MTLVQQLKLNKSIPNKDLLHLLSVSEYDGELFAAADEVRRSHYGDEVFLRGLIEFTNCCRNDCLYCGIRRAMPSVWASSASRI